MPGNQKYQMVVNVQDIDCRIVDHPEAEIGVEVLAPRTVAASNFVRPRDFIDHTFQLAFSKELPSVFKIQVNYNKGLQHLVLGRYEVERPK